MMLTDSLFDRRLVWESEGGSSELTEQATLGRLEPQHHRQLKYYRGVRRYPVLPRRRWRSSTRRKDDKNQDVDCSVITSDYQKIFLGLFMC